MFDAILTRFDTFLLMLTLFDTLACSKFQERVVSPQKKTAAPEASRKTLNSGRFPAGFRPDSGRIPAGSRPDSGRIPAGYVKVR